MISRSPRPPHTLSYLHYLQELGLEAVLDAALEHVGDVGVLEVLLHVHDVGRAEVAALLVAGLGAVQLAGEVAVGLAAGAERNVAVVAESPGDARAALPVAVPAGEGSFFAFVML